MATPPSRTPPPRPRAEDRLDAAQSPRDRFQAFTGSERRRVGALRPAPESVPLATIGLPKRI